MAPFYQRYKKNLKLHQDDIRAIQVKIKAGQTCLINKINFFFLGNLWYKKKTEI